MKRIAWTKQRKILYGALVFFIILSTIGVVGLEAIKEVLFKPAVDFNQYISRAEANTLIAKGIEYRKIFAHDDVPSDIWDYIANMDLKRGSAGFTRMHFSGESLYMLLCGGEQYQNGYDVEIIDIDYKIVGWVNSDNQFNSVPISDDDSVFTGVYQPIVHEIASDSIMPYAKEFKYPFVIFELSTKILDSDFLDLHVYTDAEEHDDALYSLFKDEHEH